MLQELIQHFKSTVLQLKEEKRTLQELRNCFLQPRIRKQLILVQTPSVWGTPTQWAQRGGMDGRPPPQSGEVSSNRQEEPRETS